MQVSSAFHCVSELGVPAAYFVEFVQSRKATRASRIVHLLESIGFFVGEQPEIVLS